MTNENVSSWQVLLLLASAFKPLVLCFHDLCSMLELVTFESDSHCPFTLNNFLIVFFSTSLSLAGNSGLLTSVRHSSHIWAMLPIPKNPISVCSIFMHQNNNMGASVIFNVCTGVDACNCTRGLYRHHTRESALEVDPERKFPAALGTQTHISIALGFLVRCSTNRTIPASRT